VLSLCIDIGNSRIKTGIFLNDKLVFKAAYPDLNSKQIADLFSTYPDLKKGILSSVAGDRPDMISEVKQHCDLHVLDKSSLIPITIDYDGYPGNDRICSAVAAFTMVQDNAALIVDCGTCITYSIIVGRSFKGGAISPGIQLRFRSLNDYTANLPLLNYDNADHPLTGNSTHGSIYSGVLNAALLEVDAMITKYKDQYPDLTVFLTGGMSGFFENGLKNGIFADADLVLKGLYHILQLNASKRS
jgi:type III pantothenate kinase